MDVQRPVPGEAALLQGPVTAVRRRITELLQEWPEHPILAQLLTVSNRLLGKGFCIFSLHCWPAGTSFVIRHLNDTLLAIVSSHLV